MEKHVERKLLIAKLVHQAFGRRPGSKSAAIWGSDINEFSPLLAQFDTFYTAAERVVDELTPGFEIAISEYFGHPNDMLGIKINDPKRLDRYIAEKEIELAKIRKENSHHSFILDEEANLFLVDSEVSPYPIERGSLRHKLIYYLAKDGGYMSAAQLAEKVNSTPKRIRTTVGQLRDKINVRFDIPGIDLIQSRDTGSYCAGSIFLKVPKGYTP